MENKETTISKGAMKLEELIRFYQRTYDYTRVEAIKSIRYDLKDIED